MKMSKSLKHKAKRIYLQTILPCEITNIQTSIRKKIYIKIVANSFLVIPESRDTLLPVDNRSFVWLADSKGFVASAWSWLEEIAWPWSVLCSTMSIATVSLETKANKDPSCSCCQEYKQSLESLFNDIPVIIFVRPETINKFWKCYLLFCFSVR